jgi:hypothetical protein
VGRSPSHCQDKITFAGYKEKSPFSRPLIQKKKFSVFEKFVKTALALVLVLINFEKTI